jgi:hypothetical protein
MRMKTLSSTTTENGSFQGHRPISLSSDSQIRCFANLARSCCSDSYTVLPLKIYEYRDSSDFFGRVADELLEMYKLKDGWDSYSAPSPTKVAMGNAFSFVGSLKARDLRPFKVVPSVVGGIAFSFAFGSREAFVEFYNDGNVLCGLLKENTEPQIIELPQDTQDWSLLLNQIENHLNG